MTKDRSLEKIDLVKLLAYLFVFILVCIIMVLAVVMPSIKEYKITKEIHNDKIVNLIKIDEIYKEDTNALLQIQKDNEKEFFAMSNAFSKEDFIDKSSKFFSKIKLKELKHDAKNEFLKHEFSMSATMKAPQNLYDFIVFVNSYPNIIKISLPIEMTKDGENINLNLNLKIYSLNKDQDVFGLD